MQKELEVLQKAFNHQHIKHIVKYVRALTQEVKESADRNLQNYGVSLEELIKMQVIVS